MFEIRPRETVILAAGFAELVAWYRDVLGFQVTRLFEDGFHFCNMETTTGIRIGIGAADEMGITPGDRRNNTVVLQIEVDDLPAFFTHLEEKGTTIQNSPKFDKAGEFWFGGIADPEGNPIWVVDRNCP